MASDSWMLRRCRRVGSWLLGGGNWGLQENRDTSMRGRRMYIMLLMIGIEVYCPIVYDMDFGWFITDWVLGQYTK